MSIASNSVVAREAHIVEAAQNSFPTMRRKGRKVQVPGFLTLSFARRSMHSRDLFLDGSLVQRLTIAWSVSACLCSVRGSGQTHGTTGVER
jgi:hypothetical protein